MKCCQPIVNVLAKPAILFALLLFGINAHGALNKWVDADGKVQYSDQPPPPNVKAQIMVVPLSAKGMPVSASGVAAQKSFVERDAERKKEQKAKEEANKKSAQQQESALIKQKNCTGAKANLKTFESEAPVATYDENGETVAMDSATRQQKIEEMHAQINKYCN